MAVVPITRAPGRVWSFEETKLIRRMQRVLKVRGIYTDIEWYWSDVGDPVASFLAEGKEDAIYNVSRVERTYIVLDEVGHLVGRALTIDHAVAKALYGGVADPVGMMSVHERVIEGFQRSA